MHLNIGKKIILLLSLFIAFKQIKAYQIQESIFSKIAGQLLKASEKPTLTREEIISIIDPNDPSQINKEKVRQILKEKIQKHKNRKIVLDLFDQNQLAKQEQIIDDENTCLTSSMFWQNLELFCGQNTLPTHLLNIINKAHSEAGTIMLAKMLAEPTTDIHELTRRQNIIKELLQNPEMFEQLDSIVKNFSQIEEDLLSFWDEKVFNNLFGSDFYYPPEVLSFLPETMLNNVFPKTIRNYLNQNSFSLEALATANNFSSTRLMLHELREIGMNRILRFIKNNYTSSPNKKIITDRWFNIYCDYHEFLHEWHSGVQNWKDKNFFSAANNFLWAFIDFDSFSFDIYNLFSSTNSIFKTIKNEQKNIKTLKIAYSKLRNAATAINSAIELKKIIDQSTMLTNNIKCLEKTKYLFDGTSSKSKKFDKLINFLTGNTFSQNPTFLQTLFSRGKILASSYLILRTQNKLVDIIQAIGEIDAYLSIAKLYKESTDKNATYCFAEYLDQETPYFALQGFWTPFINQETVVTNDIELGKTDLQRNAIISGPNAGGKSTILKSIIVNLLFAQTIGIAPSKQLTLTPFTYLDTYLNIVDDIAAGHSLFKSEVLRVKELLETLKKLNPKKCCVIMDEMFNGTNPLEGEAASYAVGKYLATLPNTITLVASHYSKMTNLQENTDRIFKNYKVSVNKNEDKSLSFPFKLEEGKTNQTIAIDILENENFDSQIINDAHSIIFQN